MLQDPQMVSDAQLAADIRPASAPTLAIRRVFVTGATGMPGNAWPKPCAAPA
jgi:hypothetical protein